MSGSDSSGVGFASSCDTPESCISKVLLGDAELCPEESPPKRSLGSQGSFRLLW